MKKIKLDLKDLHENREEIHHFLQKEELGSLFGGDGPYPEKTYLEAVEPYDRIPYGRVYCKVPYTQMYAQALPYPQMYAQAVEPPIVEM